MVAKRGVGRPNLYAEKVSPRMSEIIDWARAGATNAEICSALGVGYSNFCTYINKYSELKDSLSTARLSGVPAVKLALYKRAIGYEYEEKKMSVRRGEDGDQQEFMETTKKIMPPDVGAIQTYLRNYTDDFKDRDKFTYDFKKMELELKKISIENNNF